MADEQPKRWVGTAVLVGAALGLCVMATGAPILVAVSRVGAGIAREGWQPQLNVAPALLAESLAWAAGIAALATLIAWPAAWLIRARGWGAAAWLLVPMMLPSYLAYAAYGMARAPGTLIGDWVEHLAQRGWKDAPLIAGDVVAVVGLALWAWPLAAVVMGAFLRRIDGDVFEALEVDGATGARKWIAVLSLSRRGVAGAFLTVCIVMLGSTIPLQVAQIRTYSLAAWEELTTDPSGWKGWGAAWPMVAIGLAAGWWASRVGLRGFAAAGNGARCGERMGRSWGALAASAAAWSLSVLAPLVSFVLTVREWKSFGTFWRVSGAALAQSAWLAACVGCACVVIALGVWHGLSAGVRASRAAGWAVRLALMGALMPGLLAGAAIALAANWLDLRFLQDTPAGVFLGHVARFACVPALAGCWLAALEGREVREQRRLDGADDALGWAAACVPGGAGLLVAVFAAGMVLSLHEIEATVVLEPPGTASLAQTVLAWLHFARYEELSAGGAYLVGFGLVIALAATWGMRRFVRTR